MKGIYESALTSDLHGDDVRLFYAVEYLRYLTKIESARNKKLAIRSVSSKLDSKDVVHMLFSAELDAMDFDTKSYLDLSKGNNELN